MNRQRQAWTIEQAQRAVMEALAAMPGSDGCSYTLVRFGTNALFRIAERELVLRVTSPSNNRADVERTASVALTLASHGLVVPMPVPTWDGHAIFESSEGNLVSAWEWLEDIGMPTTPADLGRVLRRLHGVETSLNLPEWEPFSKVEARFEQAKAAKAPRWLTRRLSDETKEIRLLVASVRFRLEPGLIHGDAHSGNLILTPVGPSLLDLDDVCFGPREMDLAPTLVAVRRFALVRAGWDAFSEAYGYDLNTSAACGALVRLRQLTMTTWLLTQWGSDRRIDSEIELRVRSMDEEAEPWTMWTAF